MKVANMKKEYDFSKGERGKFFNTYASKNIPVYLDSEVHRYFSQKAQDKNIELSTLINRLLKKDIDIIEEANTL